MDRTKIIESTWDYLLEKEENGDLIFEVVCGTVAIYTISFRLNDDEVKGWEQEGERFLRHLSYDVRDYPDNFMKRE
jgi:hypothetical protein